MEKTVMKVDLTVRLTEDTYKALQRSLESARKPTARQVKAHFQEVIDEEISRLIDEHGDEEEA
jgi:hypothetical protein